MKARKNPSLRRQEEQSLPQKKLNFFKAFQAEAIYSLVTDTKILTKQAVKTKRCSSKGLREFTQHK